NNTGFSASIYNEGKSGLETVKPDEHEAIWIGSSLAPKDVIEAIKIALSQWPHLKYLHLSSDGDAKMSPPDEIHYELFIGGSTSAAKRYGLQSWTATQLLSLDEDVSVREFHDAIRSKYGVHPA
ncbi:MAG TPA: hypothetical protein VGK34_08445, partial [Armatimonadota bacterium]